MKYSARFIGRTTAFATKERPVCAPYFRRVFQAPEGKTTLSVCGLGLYHLYINGKEITKGLLSPYFSDPDHIIYYDEYDLTPHLLPGKNCVGILSGSGAINAIDGHPWDDEQMPWRSAPKIAVAVEADGKALFESDGEFRTHDSPWLYEDMRSGERYDARKECPGWNMPDFDDSSWDKALFVEAPKGEKRSGEHVLPIRVVEERRPVAVTKTKKGFLYDFGCNTAGIFRMKIKNAASGQTVVMKLGEWKRKGRLDQRNILPFRYPIQECRYICKGAEEETFVPHFSYYGYRYIEVTGIKEEQANEELLLMRRAHTDMPRAGEFRCSMPELNAIQEATVNSDYSNFFHYPTDCPTREKNGWTGDASVSCEQMLLNIDCAEALKEWLFHARKGQRPDGALPTIVPMLVPTHDWGYTVGAVWDSFLTVICYRVYQYTGDREILEQNADAIAAYLTYASGRRDERGLLTNGLSDWLQTGRTADGADSPDEVGLNFLFMETARMAKEIFSLLGQESRKKDAERLQKELQTVIKKNLICGDTVIGECLTSQSLGIWYDGFEPEDMDAAKKKMSELCKKYDYEYAVGMVGTKVFPLAMSKIGEDGLLLKMMTDPDKPSYTSALRHFPTALPERFAYYEGDEEDGWYDRYYEYELPTRERKGFLKKALIKARGLCERLFGEKPRFNSLNHHFFGEPSHWMYTRILGLRVNPEWNDPNRVDVDPTYIKELDFAEGWHKTPGGKISVRWERREGKIVVTIKVEGEAHGFFRYPDGKVEKLAGAVIYKI